MNWGLYRLYRLGETTVWRPGFYKTGANPKCSTALSKPSWPSVQWKVILSFFTSIMAEIDLSGDIASSNSLWMPWPASTSWAAPELRPDLNCATSMLCLADLTLITVHWWLDSRLNLVPMTACLCSCAVWVLLLRMLPVPAEGGCTVGWGNPSLVRSL